VLGTLPDLLRLLAVPILGWAAYRDVRTRRVPNRTWLPLVAIAVLALAMDAHSAWQIDNTAFFLRVAISLGFVIPLAYGFWWMGGFGGADAKAFMVIAVLFPTFPTFYLGGVALPLSPSAIGVFSLSILSNTVLVGLVYPLAVALGNLLRGNVAPAMLIGRPVAWDRLPEAHGRLLETPDGFTRRGLDLDALRMYLEWRGESLESVRADPERLRDPDSLPDEPTTPGDGAVATDGGERVDDDEQIDHDQPPVDDRWGAEAFLDDIDHSAYGTSPGQLRAGLDVLVAADEVWLSPGIPFLVPTFVGLVVGLTYGDVLYSLLLALGLA
jgi:preflagellin peptidase FlaK